jgi:bacterioferritin (cytochrome b1)
MAHFFCDLIMKITTKIIVFINVMVAAILTILAVLNYFKYQNLVNDFTASKLSVFSNELRESAIKADRLGLQLDNLPQITNVLRQIAQKEGRIEAIFVFDGRKTVLSQYSKDSVAGETIYSLIDASLKKSKGAREWSINDEKYIVFGRFLIENAAREKIYSIFFYSKNALITDYASMKSELFYYNIYTLVPIIVVLGILIFLIFRPLQSAYNQIRHSTSRAFDSSNPHPDTGHGYEGTLLKIKLKLEQIRQSLG